MSDAPADRARAERQAERMVAGYVARGPYELFPDETRVRAIVRGLAENKLRHGKMYCPCMPIEESVAQGTANICPCEAHHRDIARDGYCECALFVSRTYLARAAHTDATPADLPPVP